MLNYPVNLEGLRNAKYHLINLRLNKYSNYPSPSQTLKPNRPRVSRDVVM